MDFRTGYHSIRDAMKSVFGEETIEQTGPVWGLDHEGEVRGCYRPSGHPGVCFILRIYFSVFRDSNFCYQLWYGMGSFYHSRFSSKQLVRVYSAF
jgi:hypothetical protein